MGDGWFPDTDYKDLPEEGIEILKEHALNFYLPFDGGVKFGAKGGDDTTEKTDANLGGRYRWNSNGMELHLKK